MAGSLAHMVGPDGKWRGDLLENMKDCGDALRECYALIFYLAGGSTERVSAACNALGVPDPWSRHNDEHPEPMSIEGLHY